jgi:hypothetical protein
VENTDGDDQGYVRFFKISLMFKKEIYKTAFIK